jgi:hypothetical protein
MVKLQTRLDVEAIAVTKLRPTGPPRSPAHTLAFPSPLLAPERPSLYVLVRNRFMITAPIALVAWTRAGPPV